MAGELWTIPALYHLLAFVRRRVSGPCSAASLLPLQGFLQAASNINIRGYFISSVSSTSHIHLADSNTSSQHCPQNSDTFKARPKVSFLVNKQIRNLFSAQLTLYTFQAPLHTHLVSSSPVLLLYAKYSEQC